MRAPAGSAGLPNTKPSVRLYVWFALRVELLACLLSRLLAKAVTAVRDRSPA